MPSMDPHRLAELRSLAFHREIAVRLRQDSTPIAAARARIRRWADEGHLSGTYAARWEEILTRPLDELVHAILDPSERGAALRQTTPFVGLIDPRTRWRIHREVA